MTLGIQPTRHPAPRSVHSTTPSPLVDMSERSDRARPVDGPGRRNPQRLPPSDPRHRNRDAARGDEIPEIPAAALSPAGCRPTLHESILFRAYRVPARIEPCACGGAVVAFEDVAGAVREHQATPEHRAWRAERWMR